MAFPRSCGDYGNVNRLPLRMALEPPPGYVQFVARNLEALRARNALAQVAAGPQS